MNKNFWLKFAISEALAVAQAAVMATNLTDAQKKALQDLITAGQECEAVF